MTAFFLDSGRPKNVSPTAWLRQRFQRSQDSTRTEPWHWLYRPLYLKHWGIFHRVESVRQIALLGQASVCVHQSSTPHECAFLPQVSFLPGKTSTASFTSELPPNKTRGILFYQTHKVSGFLCLMSSILWSSQPIWATSDRLPKFWSWLLTCFHFGSWFLLCLPVCS